MAKDRIAEATARDPIALKLGVYYANTKDSSQDHIAYAEQIQEFIAEVDHAIDIMNSVNTQLSNPDVLGSVFSPAHEAITKAEDSIKHVEVALKILKAGHYSINNLIIHHEQSILDDHFLGVHPPHVGTRALAQRYKYDLPLEFVNKEIFYYMAAGRTYRQHAHHAADIVNNNVKVILGLDPNSPTGADRPVYDAQGNTIPWEKFDAFHDALEKKYGKTIADETLQRIGLAFDVDYSWNGTEVKSGKDPHSHFIDNNKDNNKDNNQSNGHFDENHRWRYDSSELMAYILDPTGTHLKPGTYRQFPQLEDAGKLLPVHSPSDLQPGDLLYWGKYGSDHVAMYLGEDPHKLPLILEAPENNQNIHITPLTNSRFNTATKNDHGQIMVGRVL